jgi:hypothetical protein
MHKPIRTRLSKISFFLIIFISFNFSTKNFAQDSLKFAKETGFYFSWGYNKDYFSKSDIHFENSGSDNYDFKILDCKAKDRPGFKDILKTDITIPQFVYRLGYYFKKKSQFGIEINFDHAKYIVTDDQTLRVTGQIRGRAIDKDTLVNNDFVHLEHTNGANYLMANLLYRIKLFESKNGNSALSLVFKTGMGTVIPKTDVTFMGTRLDNQFHIAGFIAGEEIAIRYRIYKGIMTEFSSKSAYANYFNALGVGTAKVSHSFFTTMFVLTLGYQF